LFQETPTVQGLAVGAGVTTGVGAAVTVAVVTAGVGVAELEQAEATSAATEIRAAALRLTIIGSFLLWKFSGSPEGLRIDRLSPISSDLGCHPPINL
jgi:hypothetical protein